MARVGISARLRQHFRAYRTNVGITVPAAAAYQAWQSGNVRLVQIAAWLTSQIGRTVTPIEASEVIVRFRPSPERRFCRACGRTLHGDRRRVTCGETCQREWRRTSQRIRRYQRRGTPLRCEVCAKPVPRPSARHTLCSDACAKRKKSAERRRLTAKYGRRARLSPRVCPGCARRFRPKFAHQRYCGSDACRKARDRALDAKYKAAMRLGPVEGAVCHVCGERFLARRRSQRYCSEACRKAAKNAQNRASRARERNGEVVTRICPICGEAIERARGTTIYCGDQCRREAVRRCEADAAPVTSQGLGDPNGAGTCADAGGAAGSGDADL